LSITRKKLFVKSFFRKQETGSRKQEAENRKQGNRKQKTGSRETGSRERDPFWLLKNTVLASYKEKDLSFKVLIKLKMISRF